MPRVQDTKRVGLRYFEDVLSVEFGEISRRRAARGCGPIARNPSTSAAPAPHSSDAPDETRSGRRLTNDALLFERATSFAKELPQGPTLSLPPPAAAQSLDPSKQRPLPLPCDATGLALSGGGVRSAALSFGALQAFSAKGRLGSFDYLSTVSGGGYVGATLTAGLAMSKALPSQRPPFGDGVADGAAVAHLRDFSNYLFPRDRSALRNWTDVIAILLRGLVANAVPVSATILGLALLTVLAYPNFAVLLEGSYLWRLGLVMVQLASFERDYLTVNGGAPFAFTLWLFCGLCGGLLIWAIVRSHRNHGAQSDAASPVLQLTGWLVGLVAVSAFLDLQPVAIHALASVLGYVGFGDVPSRPVVSALHAFLMWAFAPFVHVQNLSGTLTFAGAAAALSAVGHVLQESLAAFRNAKGAVAITVRLAARTALVVLAAMIAPLALWGAFLYLTVTLIEGWSGLLGVPDWTAAGLFLALAICAFTLNGNSYSLLRFYRDRLSCAFVFWVPPGAAAAPLDGLKLSALKPSLGPYPILNSALNIEGSKDANRRGRNADFFTFTPHFIGSDLTLYAPTENEPDGRVGMEAVEPMLDLPTAMAVSGAAVSSDMGSGTIRALAPTLALLNIRLGCWLHNPRWLAQDPKQIGLLTKARKLVISRLYLLAESLGLLDETSPLIYLTDGGHIENLGIYELLKRGAKLIAIIDGEADPDMTFASLQTIERYARIDFGVRVNLPWSGFATAALAEDEAIDACGAAPSLSGPHCAVGRILYPDGALGVLLYFKASLSGDEPDYVLGYRKRNPSFPYETTADQFFTEEQFEAYRALGFHIVSRFFDQADDFAWANDGEGCFPSKDDVFAAIDAALPKA